MHPQRSRGASRGARLTAAAAKEVAPLRQPPSRIREEELLLQQESFSYARPRVSDVRNARSRRPAGGQAALWPTRLRYLHALDAYRLLRRWQPLWMPCQWTTSDMQAS